jgi:hypothetical protein
LSPDRRASARSERVCASPEPDAACNPSAGTYYWLHYAAVCASPSALSNVPAVLRAQARVAALLDLVDLGFPSGGLLRQGAGWPREPLGP